MATPRSENWLGTNRQNGPRPALRYGMAVLGSLAAFALRLAMAPVLGRAAPLATFYLAVILVAYLCGTGPAYVAATLGAVLGFMFFIPLPFAAAIADASTILWFGLYAAVTVLACAAIDSQRKQRLRTEAALAAARASEERLSFTLRASGMGTWCLDGESGQVQSSRENLSGYDSDVPIRSAEDFLERVLPEDRERVGRIIAAARSGGGDVNFECRIRREDGEVRWIWLAGWPWTGQPGARAGLTGLVQDITERKLQEGVLARAAMREQLMAEVVGRLLASEEPQAIIDDLARRVMEHLGCDVFFNFLVDRRAHKLRLNACAGIPEATARSIEWLDYGVAVCGCVARSGERIIAENILETEDHRTDLVKSFGVQAYACHPLVAQGKLIGTLSFGSRTKPRFTEDELSLMHSVTDHIAIAVERMQTRTALRESEYHFRELCESLPQLVWVAAPDGSVEYVSPQWTAYTGIPEAIYRDGANTREQVHPDDREHVVEAWRAANHSGSRFDMELRIRRFDGAYRWFKVSALPLRDDQGRIVRWFGSSTDVDDLKNAEKALRESEAFSRKILSSSLNAVCVFDVAQGRPVFLNPEYSALTGYTLADLAAMRPEEFRELFHPDDRSRLDEFNSTLIRSAEGEVLEAEFRFKTSSGRWMPSLARGAAFARAEDGTATQLIVTFLDITRRKDAEAALRQAQKDESIALLAGGIAHDFNNLLTGVLGHASLLDERAAGREHVDAIMSGAQKCADLTRQLLAYAGKANLAASDIDLSEAIQSVAKLVVVSVPKTTELVLDLAPDLPTVWADGGQINQIAMNLIINAAEAIGPAPGGRISVRTGREIVGGSLTDALQQPVRPGNYVSIEVADNGPGMNAATRASVFEPFFSTKRLGRGLGLAAVAGNVRAQKGAILLDTAPGQGCRFRVLLPASGNVHAPRQPQSTILEEPAAVRPPGLILLIEDEDLVARFFKAALKKCGYTVLLAADGRQGLSLFEQRADEIDAVVLDLGLPGVPGGEVLAAIKRRRPEVAVLVTSGYNDAEAVRLCKDQAASAFLAKPCTASELAAQVRRVIGERGHPDPEDATRRAPEQRSTPSIQ